MSHLSSNGPSPLWQRLPANLPIAYLLWLVSLGLSIAGFFFGRIFAVSVAELVDLGYWQVSFIDRLSVVLLGLAGSVLVILVEHWYRTGVEKGRLWPRFAKVTAWQLGLILAGMITAPFTGG